MSENIYVGNAKEKKFDDGGSILNVTLDVDDLAKAFSEYGWKTPAGKRKIKVTVKKGREVDQYGNTHYIIIDTFKPEPKSNNVDNAKKAFQDDIPAGQLLDPPF